MRIVQVCPYDIRRYGGVQAHVRDLSAWLRAQGHEVRIISPPPGTAAPPGPPPAGAEAVGRAWGISVHGTGYELSRAAPRELAALQRGLTAWGAEIVHLHTPCTPMLSWQLWRRLRLPAVATFHSTPPDAAARGPRTRAARLLSGYFLRRVEASVFPSAAPLELFADLPAPRPPRVLPPTIDLAGWREAGRAAAARKAARGGLSVIFLGRLEPRKGIDVLLAAWPAIAAAVPGARLTVAGDGPMRAAVEAAAGESAARPVRYLGAPDPAAARAAVADADIFAAPARYGESFGLVLLEAMAAGTVPVAAANAGYATVLAGCGDDLLVPPGDAAALAARIVALAGDRAALARLGARGGARAAEFDVSRQGPHYEALFRDVLAGRRD